MVMNMNGITGNNQFNNGRFDFFEWSAKYYTTPQEVLDALTAASFFQKEISAIYIIGAVQDNEWDRQFQAFEQLRFSGISFEEEKQLGYPHLNNVLLPREVEVCEPIQFVFADSSTLELLPLDSGGARIGVNTIPAGMVDGINRSEIDGNLFFAPALGCHFSSVDYCFEKGSEQSYSVGRTWRTDFGEWQRITSKISFKLYDCNDNLAFQIILYQTASEWYKIMMTSEQSGVEGLITYEELQKSIKRVNQVYIHKGMLEINAICREAESNGSIPYNFHYGMCLNDFVAPAYLSVFLDRYFDASVQERDEDEDDGSEQNEFDWYGWNIYTYEAMNKMLKDIKDTIEQLQKCPDAPDLYDLIDQFPYDNYLDEHSAGITHTKAQYHDLSKKDIPVAIDFYQRFIRQIEAMMRIPGTDAISFLGP